jgi:hypothetical protein
MNDTDIENGLLDYYHSITPVSSVHATTLVHSSIKSRREASNSGYLPAALTRILAGFAAVVSVAIVAAICFSAWRTGPNRGLPGVAVESPSVTAQASLGASPSAELSGGPTPEASATSPRPTPTLRDPTRSTPSHKFSPTGSMNGRYDTATLLLDGRVLMTGDHDPMVEGYAYTSKAELYDPATGKFSPTGSMLELQGWGRTVTRLQDGRVLVAGGTVSADGAPQSTAELYDPTAGTFGLTGSLASARIGHTATLLENGEVLIAGGITPAGVVATAELYDPATGTFRPTGSMMGPRSQAVSALLRDGRVLLLGGFNGSAMLGSAEIYDPTTGEFSKSGSLGDQWRIGCTVTVLQDGRVLVAGGGDPATLASAVVYDPTTGNFTPTGSMAEARTEQTATLLLDGKVLIAGGSGRGTEGYVSPSRQPAELAEAPAFVLDRYESEPSLASGHMAIFGMVGSGSGTPPRSAELYDPATGKFSSTGPMGSGRVWATATLLLDGRVLVAGGDSATGMTAELYQP